MRLYLELKLEPNMFTQVRKMRKMNPFFRADIFINRDGSAKWIETIYVRAGMLPINPLKVKPRPQHEEWLLYGAWAYADRSHLSHFCSYMIGTLAATHRVTTEI